MVKNIAIIGGGPSAMFMFQRIVQIGRNDIVVDIFEKGERLGPGMPYSKEGALEEHITNVSGNEIPKLTTSVTEWVKQLTDEKLKKYHIDRLNFNPYKVLPRLLFGEYLEHQFHLLIKEAAKIGIEVNVFYKSEVTDVVDLAKENRVGVYVNLNWHGEYDHIIICTGHTWPKTYEEEIKGYFDSPYPPEKLEFKVNHPVAIKGASLTAIDGIKTLARQHGVFLPGKNGIPIFKLHQDCLDFKIIMHSRHGMLPAVRFHLEDSHLLKDSVLSKEVVAKNRLENDGFLSLDFIFDKNFKALFKENDLEFFEEIKDLNIEGFVDKAMELRERLDPFHLFEAEYKEAEKSIKRRESVYWKELLAVLSFAMNYPAKHFSAEDTMRLQKTLMPLISIVIAFVPQNSVEELLALHKAGILEMVPIDHDGYETPALEGGAVYHYKNSEDEQIDRHFNTFINCVGQPHLTYKDFPFKSLLSDKIISPAKLRFRDNGIAERLLKEDVKGIVKSMDGYYLSVPGIAINDNFQALDEYGGINPRIYVMAVPYISGSNPDYSGLDFGEAASEIIAKSLFDVDKVEFAQTDVRTY